jgi:hypothetical protein
MCKLILKLSLNQVIAEYLEQLMTEEPYTVAYQTLRVKAKRQFTIISNQLYIFSGERKYRADMMQPEHHWMLTGDGTPLHHSKVVNNMEPHSNAKHTWCSTRKIESTQERNRYLPMGDAVL